MMEHGRVFSSPIFTPCVCLGGRERSALLAFDLWLVHPENFAGLKGDANARDI
jgi:hypothetical protein